MRKFFFRRNGNENKTTYLCYDVCRENESDYFSRVIISFDKKDVYVCFCFCSPQDLIPLVKEQAEKELLPLLEQWKPAPLEYTRYTGVGIVLSLEKDKYLSKEFDVATVQLGNHQLKFSNFDERDYFPKNVGERIKVGYDEDGQYVTPIKQDESLSCKEWKHTINYWQKNHDPNQN